MAHRCTKEISSVTQLAYVPLFFEQWYFYINLLYESYSILAYIVVSHFDMTICMF